MPLLGRHYRLRPVLLTVSKIRKADKEQPPDNVATSTICGQYSPLYVSVGQPTLADETAREAFCNALAGYNRYGGPRGGTVASWLTGGLRGLDCLGLNDSEHHRLLWNCIAQHTWRTLTLEENL